ncbi:hypothetical protein BD408DRAFT_412441 [Parasitella parasitica]|nr:hypothetical protein BD408DRAFT_412441 [Parasitella parasitica]
MAALAKKTFNISQNTLLFIRISTCSRVVFATTSQMLFYTNRAIKEEQIDAIIKHKEAGIEDEKPSHSLFSPVELLREKAQKVRQQESLRSRCRWSKEEDKKLCDMVAVHGKRWSMISRNLIDRTAGNVMGRYNVLTDAYLRGAWTKEELAALKNLGQGRAFQEIEDWQSILEKLPRKRTLNIVKQTYKHSVDPNIKHGKWSSDENEKLATLVHRFGENNMQQIASKMGSRTPRQCLERWRWQMNDKKKGKFSAEEDKRILDAVEQYGENFAVVTKAASLSRTPRHVSQHYQNVLAPDVDRSKWTADEEKRVYQAYVEHGRDMPKAKQALGSKRSLRDLWNHFSKYNKLVMKGLTEKQK